MSGNLTRRQQEVLNFIRMHRQKTGASPTVREIAGHFGFASPLSAHQHLKALARKGYLEHTPRKSRGVRIAGPDEQAMRAIPLVGRVRAGRPLLAIEDAEAGLLVDRQFFRSRDAFALRVTGESMIGDGILDGDIVVVKPERDPQNGSVCVVLIGDEVTVKRLYRRKAAVRLVPSNPAMQAQTLHPRDVQVLGRVIGLIRKL